GQRRDAQHRDERAEQQRTRTRQDAELEGEPEPAGEDVETVDQQAHRLITTNLVTWSPSSSSRVSQLDRMRGIESRGSVPVDRRRLGQDRVELAGGVLPGLLVPAVLEDLLEDVVDGLAELVVALLQADAV